MEALAQLRRKVSKVFLRKQVRVAVVGVFLHVLAILMCKKLHFLLRACCGVNRAFLSRHSKRPPKSSTCPCKDVFTRPNQENHTQTHTRRLSQGRKFARTSKRKRGKTRRRTQSDFPGGVGKERRNPATLEFPRGNTPPAPRRTRKPPFSIQRGYMPLPPPVHRTPYSQRSKRELGDTEIESCKFPERFPSLSLS